jgi:hypothetical protein
MLELRGKSDIGDKINTQIIAPLVHANARLARSDFPDFNDSNKLGGFIAIPSTLKRARHGPYDFFESLSDQCTNGLSFPAA